MTVQSPGELEAWRWLAEARNSLGQVAGFVSPFLVGWIKDATGSTDAALYILSTVLLVGAVLAMCVPARLVNR